MKVAVLVFEHRHGCDISVHADYEMASAATAAIARRDWGEARERAPHLPACPPSSDAEAVALYFEAQADTESAQLSTCEVQGLDAAAIGAPAIARLYEAAKDVELAALDEMVERAGLGFKCKAETSAGPCHWMNVGSPASCEACGAGREDRKEV